MVELTKIGRQRIVLNILVNREDKEVIATCVKLDEYLQQGDLTLGFLDEITEVLKQRLNGVDLQFAQNSLADSIKRINRASTLAGKIAKTAEEEAIANRNRKLNERARELGFNIPGQFGEE